MGLTVLQIADRLGSEADAYRYMEHLRWGDGEALCPHCGNLGATYIRPVNGVSRKTRTGANSERRVWRCAACDKQFSVITGTVFHGTKVALRTWILVFFEMCSSKNGIAAREIERKYGVCSRTAWFMMHRLREAMKTDSLVAAMSGTIVADETWIGGDPKNRHKHAEPIELVRITHVPRHNKKTDKQPVVSLIDAATGEVRSRVVPAVTGATLDKIMQANVDVVRSHLQTDASTVYSGLGRQFISHKFVDHKAGEYVRNGASTNRAEGYFSQLKRSIDGTHHHVSVEHLPRYLAEFDYRYTTRKLSDGARMAKLMGQVGGRRLTYKRVSGG